MNQIFVSFSFVLFMFINLLSFVNRVIYCSRQEQLVIIHLEKEREREDQDFVNFKCNTRKSGYNPQMCSMFFESSLKPLPGHKLLTFWTWKIVKLFKDLHLNADIFRVYIVNGRQRCVSQFLTQQLLHLVFSKRFNINRSAVIVKWVIFKFFQSSM